MEKREFIILTETIPQGMSKKILEINIKRGFESGLITARGSIKEALR